MQGRAISQAKVGGRAGSYFTDGLRNQHWDAYIDGPHSSNIVKSGARLFISTFPTETTPLVTC
jgi:hypothetical protein